MKKIPRITINRIELCKQPKSGAFRTAILTPFHRMSSVFRFGSPAAKNIQQIVYKLNESRYEDLNTRHYLCCQTHLLQLSGWGFIILTRRRHFFTEQESFEVVFLFLFFLNQRQLDMYLLLKCTNLKNSKGFLLPVLCLFWY